VGGVRILYGVGCRLRLLGVTEGHLGGGANLALAYQNLINLVGVTSGVLLLGENLTATKILGGAVIVLGVYLARRR
jgi:drug/metabolite transporter (DMT)-like permease